ncbi:hypothetical protein [Salinigranum salinum]|nr:hypothetical protein [Salinigranum salinum]
MQTSSPLTPQQLAMKRHLETALDESTDPEVRFHLRQALQMVT